MAAPTLGVIFHPRFPPATLADYARRAEAAGFDQLWLWDDCFLPGALTSAAIALAATQRLQVGIGLLPATAYNPLFAAMEITTLALAFPGRILPGFGHGVSHWMAQIGAAPKSSLQSVEETVSAVGRLLRGEQISVHGTQVHLEQVQLQTPPASQPPLYVGAIRAKTLRLAGRAADGTLLDGMSSPAYARWALEHIRAGMAEAGRTRHTVAAYLYAKVSPDGASARAAMRRMLAARLPGNDIQLEALGIERADAERLAGLGPAAAEHISDAWLDALAAAGTPQQAADAVLRLAEVGVDTVVLQPADGDPGCLDEYARYLLPLLR